MDHSAIYASTAIDAPLNDKCVVGQATTHGSRQHLETLTSDAWKSLVLSRAASGILKKKKCDPLFTFSCKGSLLTAEW